MPEKFKNKYTIKSVRLKDYDYSQNGMYFLTICTKDREEYFGSIVNGKMILNDMGKIAENFWKEIPNHFSNVRLDEFVVMPNHVHGIIEIVNVETQFIASRINKGAINRDALKCVSTENKTKSGGITGLNNPSLNYNSLSNIIKLYKGRCVFEIRKQLNPITFAWQSRYYDRIIRNEIELNRIREYIFKNPATWERDRNNPENLFM